MKFHIKVNYMTLQECIDNVLCEETLIGFAYGLKHNVFNKPVSKQNLKNIGVDWAKKRASVWNISDKKLIYNDQNISKQTFKNIFQKVIKNILPQNQFYAAINACDVFLNSINYV